MNTKNNKSFQNSQLSIRNSFFKLLEEKGIESTITVSDIIRGAKINRSTFYRHYIDVKDLTEKICVDLQSTCYMEMKRTGRFEDYFHEMLGVIEKNKTFFSYYLLNNPNQFKNPEFQEVWKKSIVPLFIKHGVKKEETMKYYFSYYSGGFISILSEWIMDGCVEDKDKIFEIVMQCMRLNSVNMKI